MIPDGSEGASNEDVGLFDFTSRGGGGGAGIYRRCDCGIDGGGNGSPATGKRLKKGPWTAAEDAILIEHVRKYGEGNWNGVYKNSGLARCGKSCRLRWANHLRPNLKKGSFTHDEERLILQLHAKYGNKWARMATLLPGRTDNEIKNFWNTRVKRRLRQGLPLYPPDIQPSHKVAQTIQNSLSPRPALTPISHTTPSLSLSTSPHLHHHYHHPHHLPSPTHLSSSQLLSPHQSFHSPTLTLLDHSSTSSSCSNQNALLRTQNPPILRPPLYRFGRLRNTVSIKTHSRPYSTPSTPTPSPFLASPISTPLSQFSTPQLSPINFEPKSLSPSLDSQFSTPQLSPMNFDPTGLEGHFSLPQMSPINFEAMSAPPSLDPQFEFDDAVLRDSAFSVESEPPSSQIFTNSCSNDATKSTKIERDVISPHRSDGEYLAELLKEAQAAVGVKGLRRDDLNEKRESDDFASWFSSSSSRIKALSREHLNEDFVGDVFGSWVDSKNNGHLFPVFGRDRQVDNSGSVYPTSGKKPKEEPMEQIDSMNEDSDMLITIPMSMRVPEWCTRPEEHSNGQSSGITDDGSELKMMNHPSSFSTAASSENGSCSWSFMPRIC